MENHNLYRMSTFEDYSRVYMANIYTILSNLEQFYRALPHYKEENLNRVSTEKVLKFIKSLYLETRDSEADRKRTEDFVRGKLKN